MTVALSKIILVVLNVTLIICGSLLVALGVVSLNNIFGYDVKDISIFSMVLGGSVILLALFGCLALGLNSKKLLFWYGCFLLAIFTLQVFGYGVGASIAVNHSLQIDREVQQYLSDLYREYQDILKNAKIIDQFQKKYKCCGLDGPRGTEVIIRGTDRIIPSCCFTYPCTSNSFDAYSDGCLSHAQYFIGTVYKCAVGFAMGFGALELTSAIFAFWIRSQSLNKFY